ncbi:ribosomal RNA-processing protein 7-domain-containing protein [Cokeromyces recurvatus]|uniref:ribosomal RNA-processing protein 7-domain-containing protein n=1 Tax=Cokeromyces recurvatus TaxID=90255 RepID=UPI00221EE9B5|nr:ribosomal RNA-processing protein 7-domain-containing protein [Cokeromyces recurvatus]KAI7905674.1 ribosomal RNA-processing protein 7-domain-containing protein [Cokeromyces recurvatus]
MTKAKKETSQESKEREKTSKQLETFQGFKVLPVIMDENNKSIRHYFFMKKHESKSLEDENIKDRTLFLANLPPDTTDYHIKKLFKGHPIDQITYSSSGSSKKNQKEKEEKEDKPNRELRQLFVGGSSAHVVFSTNGDLDQVLSMHRVEKKWAKEDEKTGQPLGFQRYILQYELSRPNPMDLQQEVDSFMMKFKADEYQKEREQLERMNKMDEDGFTVVVRHKKNKTTDGTINVSAISTDVAEAQKEYHQKKKKELVNFYRFQMREQKQNELTELRKRFEEDKAKIAKLKQNRKFKPY